ncbi:peptidase family M28 [Colletotrichum zoysiae]|uniref:Peptide hydrolase n=1 Tax=Colletotrichum zoysiae TaxID=1216348 RepID=A0AAD9M1V0_9PEZI|nr:peptidase family M28 [Colletotrichum zoysiae]
MLHSLTVLGLAGMVVALPQLVVPASDPLITPSPLTGQAAPVLGDCRTQTICRDFINKCGQKYGRPWPTYAEATCTSSIPNPAHTFHSHPPSLVSRQTITYPTTLTHVTEANSLISRVSNTNPQSWLKTLTDFNNRDYRSTTGTQASTWLYNQAVAIADGYSAITVSPFNHSFNQPSIIVKYPGTSSNLIIVGAHFDSTAGSTTARSPGADDNATGTVNLLEALRVLVAAGFRPKNTIEFHFYAGEEGGLLGSQAIFSHYRSAGKRVLGMLNQDMTGYSPGGRATVYTDYVDTAFTAYVRLVTAQFTDATPASASCGYGCSDHVSARSNGFPAAFVSGEPFMTSNPNIHSSRDAYESIQWDAVLRHSKLTVGFLVEASYLG